MRRLWAAALALMAAAAAGEAPGPHSGYDYMAPPTRALQDDDFLNPGFFLVDRGAELWSRAEGAGGRSCASCHGAAEDSMQGVAARYPVVDPGTGTLMNLEGRINAMRALMGAEPWAYEGDELLAMTAYLSFQSRGMPMEVAIDGPAAPFWEEGRRLYTTRLGQLNLACTHCHDALAGERLRGDVISEGQINAFPVFRLLWNASGSRHRMFAWCNTSLRAEPWPAGSPEYLALELYVAWRGRGLPVEAPGVRR